MCDDPGMPGRCGCPTRPTFPPVRPPAGPHFTIRESRTGLLVALAVAGLVAAAYGACALVLVPAAGVVALILRRADAIQAFPLQGTR